MRKQDKQMPAGGPRALPANVDRCSGVEEDDGTWRKGCADCLRRTDRSYFPQDAWMAPPALVAFDCEARIAPQASRRGPGWPAGAAAARLMTHDVEVTCPPRAGLE